MSGDAMDMLPIDDTRRLLTASGDAAVPRALHEAFDAHDVRDPSRGQLWHLQHEQNVALAVVWEQIATSTFVMPVSEDPQYRDRYTVTIADPGLGLDVAVWPSLEVAVPTWVLNRCIGSINATELNQQREAFRSQERNEVPGEPAVGAIWSDDARYRARLGEQLEAFVALTWDQERPTIEGAPTLSQLLEARGLSFDWLVDELAIESPRSALQLWEGARQLDQSEAVRLAESLGLEAFDLRRLSRDIPMELAAQLSRPRRRKAVCRWAKRHEMRELDARHQIEERVLQMAARSKGTAADVWDALLDRFFESELEPS